MFNQIWKPIKYHLLYEDGQYKTYQIKELTDANVDMVNLNISKDKSVVVYISVQLLIWCTDVCVFKSVAFSCVRMIYTRGTRMINKLHVECMSVD